MTATDPLLLSQWMSTHPVCSFCQQRIQKELQEKDTNKKKNSVTPKNPLSEDETCFLCERLLQDISVYINLVKNSVAGYEFSSFLLGSKIDEELQQREDDLISQYLLTNFVPLKMELNRLVGKELELLLHKEVSFTDPDILAIIDTRFNIITLQIKSLYIYGRYNKKKRGIPQTHWPCRICRGVGCRQCSLTGKLYTTSVEEEITRPLLACTKGSDESFHGAGREDVDALMLGSGRPFVVEIKNPMKRTCDLSALEHNINTTNTEGIEVNSLRLSTKEEVVRLKKATFRKQYRVELLSKKALNKEKLKEVAQILPGTTIQQCTPIRVAHRRADKCRQRVLYHCMVEQVENTRAVLVLEAESGTYIKEFISGDSGRTRPNLSDLLGTPCKVVALDVIAVQGE